MQGTGAGDQRVAGTAKTVREKARLKSPRITSTGPGDHLQRPAWLPSYIPELQGLRGLAVLAVVIYHCHPRLRGTALYRASLWGWAGVNLFFVLSGFLITSILLESRVLGGAGERHELAARVPGDQDARFLEQLTRRGHVIGGRFRGRQDGELSSGVRDAVTPLRVRLVIRSVHPSAGEYVSASHERRAFMTPDHERFRTRRAVAQHNDCRGWARVGDDRARRRGAHRPQ